MGAAAAAVAVPALFSPPSFSPYSAIAATKRARVRYCDLKTRNERFRRTLTKAEIDLVEMLIVTGHHGVCSISVSELTSVLSLKSECWVRKLLRSIETKLPRALTIYAKNRAQQKIRGKRGGYKNWYEFNLEELKRLNPFYKPKAPTQPKPQPFPEKVNQYEQSRTFARSEREAESRRVNSIVDSVVQRFWKNSNFRSGRGIFGLSLRPGASSAFVRDLTGHSEAEVSSGSRGDQGAGRAGPADGKGSSG